MNQKDEVAYRARRRVLVAGHFPPPVHGMAVATERLATLISRKAEIRLLITSATTRHGLIRHPTRLARTAGAIFRMTVDRSRSEVLYLGSDAGLGMVYTLAIVLGGRLLRYRIFLHHHSAAYVQQRSFLMAAIVRCGGERCAHVLSCEGQAAIFDNRYRAASPSIILPISYALDGDNPKPEAASRSRRPKSTLVLGHMSNLSLEKGLETVFDTLHAARAAGLDTRLVLAGPAATARDEVALAKLMAEAEGRAVHLGPVDKEGKLRFLSTVDVFLFPTRYRHESFGLVAAEAMQAGIPLIAYRAGCLNPDFVKGAGLVLEPSEDYPKLAVRQLLRWDADPEEFDSCAQEARLRIRSARTEAAVAVDAFVDLLTGSV